MGMRRCTPLMRSSVLAEGAEVMKVRHLAGHQARAELAQMARNSPRYAFVRLWSSASRSIRSRSRT
jgi:hypothetical protein